MRARKHRAGAVKMLPTRFCLFVHHTDAEREWAYDRDAHIGKLDKGLDEAQARGRTVASIKDDWKRVFAQER